MSSFVHALIKIIYLVYVVLYCILYCILYRIVINHRKLTDNIAVLQQTNNSIRSPGPVSPRDVECEGFDFLTYPRIATSSSLSTLNYDVDKRVDQSIQNFLMKLSQIGPELLSVRTRTYNM